MFSISKALGTIGLALLLTTFSVNAGHDPRSVHAGEGVTLPGICDTREKIDVFTAMVKDITITPDEVLEYLLEACPVFPIYYRAVISEVLEVFTAHSRRWFILKLFVVSLGQEGYMYWSIPILDRDA